MLVYHQPHRAYIAYIKMEIITSPNQPATKHLILTKHNN